jgi:hypothetical protein
MQVEMNPNVSAADDNDGRVPPLHSIAAEVRTVPIALVLFTIIASGVVLYCFNPSQYGFYPVCLFHSSTGLLCPGCGSLRALHQLLHGHLVEALHFNILLISALPLAAFLSARFALRTSSHQAASSAIRPAWLWWAFAVIIIFGILRNLPFAQSAWLAP